MPGVHSGDRGNWDEESLRYRSHTCLEKITFRTFSKRVGLLILSLQSVDYFGTSENY